MRWNRWSGIGVFAASALLGIYGASRAGDTASPGAAPAPANARAVEFTPPPAGAIAAHADSIKSNVDATPAAPAAPAAGALTPAQLQQLLVNLGCEVADLGNGISQVHMKRDTWNIYLNVSLSGDASTLWVSCRLSDVNDPDSIPASVWTGLLAANGDDGINFALIKPATGSPYIQLQHGIPNINVTPLMVRQNIDSMDDWVISTQNLWSPSAWPKAAPTTAPAAK